MSKHGFAAAPRHRRRRDGERAQWALVSACVLSGVALLATCGGLAARRDGGPVGAPPTGNPPTGTGSWPAHPGASGAATPSAPLPPGALPSAGDPPGGRPPGGLPAGSGDPAAGGRPPGSPGTPGAGPGAGVTRPPERPPAGEPASGAPLLTLSKADGTAPVDLSSEGTVDWAHWGLHSPRSVNRKSNGPGSITDLGNNGPRERVETGTQRFSWRNGAPDRAVTNTPSGVSACGVDTAFKLAVPAGPATRTLRVHAGVWRATGRFDVSLSGTQLSRSAEVSKQGPTSLPVVYTVRFRAPAGGQLTIRWGVTAIFQSSCGSVDLRAATLQ